MSYLQTQNSFKKNGACCNGCADTGGSCGKSTALGVADDFLKSGEIWKTIIASAIGAIAGALAVRGLDRAVRKDK